MARAIWTGALSFGLVNIPVEVHVAVRDHRPRFHLLHAADRSPIDVERVCRKEGRSVAWDDLVKGYEYEKGRFVVLTKDDFAAAALEKSRRIELLDFVKAGSIDGRYFDKPYFLTPGKGGDQAYALLREALRQTSRTGVAKFILRDVQHLAALDVLGDALVLLTLRFADELVDVATLDLPSGSGGRIRKPDLEMAKTLVGRLASEWRPEQYTDEYRDNLMRVIKAKPRGKTAELRADERSHPAQVVDLMERLRRSLDRAPRRGTAHARGAARGGRARARSGAGHRAA